MQRADKIERLYKYIQRHLDMDTFDCRVEDRKDRRVLGFSTYDEFLTFQEQKLKTASDYQLTDWETLSELLRTSRIVIPEEMFSVLTDGFAFDNEGRIALLISR